MKVLHVTTHVNIGGITNYILTLSKAVKPLGIRCVVASSGGNMEEDFIRSGIASRRLPINTKFEFGPKAIISGYLLSALVKDGHVSLIHAHTRVSQVAAAIASKRTGVPYVTTCHGYFKKRFRSVIDTWGERVIAISDAVKTHLIEDLGVDEKRVSLVYSGVDNERFAEGFRDAEKVRIREDLGLDDGPVIGQIGRLSPVKGQQFLIRAMKDILAQVPKAQAVIVGDGPDDAALKAMARSLGVYNRIRFVRSNVETPRIFAVMDVFVFPSVKEGLGIGLLEAMSAGKACVASRIGGINDIVRDGETGLLVKPESSVEISDAVLRLLNDPQLKERLGSAARMSVSERFSLGRWAEGVANVYREVVGDRTVQHRKR